jgi:hypothetical protein
VGGTDDFGSGISLSTMTSGGQMVGKGKDRVDVSLTHADPIGSTSMRLKVAYAAYTVGHVKGTPEKSQVMVWLGGGSSFV